MMKISVSLLITFQLFTICNIFITKKAFSIEQLFPCPGQCQDSGLLCKNSYH
uniref:Uncharacterized protein n=1 Tax=Anguilla anguilla TaxID=7936 RepID=A0A0E9U8F3_ANGAN